MVLDSFRFKTEEEVKKLISEFWSDCEYLVKLRILLKIFEDYSITKLESRNINKLWRSVSLEEKKNIYNSQHKYLI